MNEVNYFGITQELMDIALDPRLTREEFASIRNAYLIVSKLGRMTESPPVGANNKEIQI